MGKIKNNVVTKGFSGKFGEDLVFRQIDHKTVFAKHTPSKVPPTDLQVSVRNKFTEAAHFASAALENPQASLEYKAMAEIQKLKSAYIAAVTDYLTLPEIGGVYTAAYKGAVGDVINIKPKVPYKITEIDVTILNPDDTVLETGKAIANELKWKYIATLANPAVSGCKLVLLARDRQAKEFTFEEVLK